MRQTVRPTIPSKHKPFPTIAYTKYHRIISNHSTCWSPEAKLQCDHWNIFTFSISIAPKRVALNPLVNHHLKTAIDWRYKYLQHLQLQIFPFGFHRISHGNIGNGAAPCAMSRSSSARSASGCCTVRRSRSRSLLGRSQRPRWPRGAPFRTRRWSKSCKRRPWKPWRGCRSASATSYPLHYLRFYYVLLDFLKSMNVETQLFVFFWGGKGLIWIGAFWWKHDGTCLLACLKMASCWPTSNLWHQVGNAQFWHNVDLMKWGGFRDVQEFFLRWWSTGGSRQFAVDRLFDAKNRNTVLGCAQPSHILTCKKHTSKWWRLSFCPNMHWGALQLCHRDISGSRHSLRQCRHLLESHQAPETPWVWSMTTPKKWHVIPRCATPAWTGKLWFVCSSNLPHQIKRNSGFPASLVCLTPRYGKVSALNILNPLRQFHPTIITIKIYQIYKIYQIPLSRTTK